ncbi:hypothetical protein GE061_004527 [Apolygus lucorum]|uniref:Uncharacterized protein n=1 Tax=Apolygus lucorum TaxID=248454 RepID=A0A8S9X0Z3_APOLU|nr:hypothetical protein GE061_004527 [Apolygus lucorum]
MCPCLRLRKQPACRFNAWLPSAHLASLRSVLKHARPLIFSSCSLPKIAYFEETRTIFLDGWMFYNSVLHNYIEIYPGHLEAA